jgi:excisionase family DNA binding protein
VSQMEILKDIHEVARLLHISESWLYQKVSRREIPFVKMGRALRFDVDEIKQWVETQKHEVQRDTR